MLDFLLKIRKEARGIHGVVCVSHLAVEHRCCIEEMIAVQHQQIKLDCKPKSLVNSPLLQAGYASPDLAPPQKINFDRVTYAVNTRKPGALVPNLVLNRSTTLPGAYPSSLLHNYVAPLHRCNAASRLLTSVGLRVCRSACRKVSSKRRLAL